MSAVRRRPKFLVLLVAVAGLALVLSACAFIKEGSLNVGQLGGWLGTRSPRLVHGTRRSRKSGTPLQP